MWFLWSIWGENRSTLLERFGFKRKLTNRATLIETLKTNGQQITDLDVSAKKRGQTNGQKSHRKIR